MAVEPSKRRWETYWNDAGAAFLDPPESQLGLTWRSLFGPTARSARTDRDTRLDRPGEARLDRPAKPAWTDRLIEECRCFSQFPHCDKVVLDPQLRGSFLEEYLERFARCTCLLHVELERRQPIEGAFFGIVIQIA